MTNLTNDKNQKLSIFPYPAFYLAPTLMRSLQIRSMQSMADKPKTQTVASMLPHSNYLVKKLEPISASNRMTASIKKEQISTYHTPSPKKLLALYTKGLNIYDNNLSVFISKWTNKKLILSIKNNSESKLNKPLVNVNLNIEEKKENIKTSLQKNNIEPRINEYLNSIYTFNSNLLVRSEEPSVALPMLLAPHKDNSTQSAPQIFNNIKYSKIINYNFKTGNNKLIKNIYELLSYSFFSMSCLIGKPVLEITPEKVIIHLYIFLFKQNKNNNKFSASRSNQYLNSSINSRPLLTLDNNKSTKTFLDSNKNKLDIICEILSNYFKKPVKFELVRLHYPYFDSNILVNLFGLIVNKIKVRFIVKNLFKKAFIKNPTKLTRKSRLTFIPSFLSGINIRIAGRLMTHRVVPRKTVKNIRRGALARGKVQFLDVARFTNKNKRGAFSITISTGQNLI